MQVKDLLAGVPIAIDQQAVSVLGDPFPQRNLLGYSEHMPHKLFVIDAHVVDRRDLLVRYDQNVDGCLGFDVAKGSYLFVLVNDISRNFACNYL